MRHCRHILGRATDMRGRCASLQIALSRWLAVRAEPFTVVGAFLMSFRHFRALGPHALATESTRGSFSYCIDTISAVRAHVCEKCVPARICAGRRAGLLRAARRPARYSGRGFLAYSSTSMPASSEMASPAADQSR